MSNLKDMMGQLFQRGPRRASFASQSLTQLAAEEQAKSWTWSRWGDGRATRGAERDHLIDEIDKIASRDGGHAGRPTSAARAARTSCRSWRAQRQPQARMVRTDHILFIAPGRSRSKPSDSHPRVAGRFPIRVD